MISIRPHSTRGHPYRSVSHSRIVLHTRYCCCILVTIHPLISSNKHRSLFHVCRSQSQQSNEDHPSSPVWEPDEKIRATMLPFREPCRVPFINHRSTHQKLRTPNTPLYFVFFQSSIRLNELAKTGHQNQFFHQQCAPTQHCPLSSLLLPWS